MLLLPLILLLILILILILSFIVIYLEKYYLKNFVEPNNYEIIDEDYIKWCIYDGKEINGINSKGYLYSPVINSGSSSW